MQPRSLINGQPGDSIAVSDRGLQYGDGLFETVAVRDGACSFWDRHLRRLQDGCNRLHIPLPDPDQLTREVHSLSQGQSRCVIKVIITRGSGGRGYRVPDKTQPTRILLRSDWPAYPSENAAQGVCVRLCNHRMGINPALAGLKHLNRLEQVLARQEWDDPHIAEGLLQDHTGNVIEGTYTNLFLVRQGRLITPALDNCGVAGVMRAVILELAAVAGIDCAQRPVHVDELYSAEELFLTNSLIGIWPVRALEHWRGEPGPITRALHAALGRLYPIELAVTHD